MTWWSLNNFWFFRLAHIYAWQDIIEIIIFGVLFYHISRWLAHDKQNNLVLYFYGYCWAIIIAYYAHMPSVTLMLLLASPVVALLFIILHQRTLQKNFITLNTVAINTKQTSSTDWVTVLLRSSLIALNNKKTVFCLLERNDSMNSFVSTTLPIDAPVTQPLLDCIIASPSYNPTTMLWLTTQGKLIGANTSWIFEQDVTWAHESAARLDDFKEHALIITAKTDALLFCIEPTTRLATIVMHGKIIEKLSSEQAHSIITKYVHLNELATKKQGEQFHETRNEKKLFEQRNP